MGKSDGLTLVELIISIFILSILALFVIIISTSIVALTSKTQSRNIALTLAQEKIEELRSNLNVPDWEQDEPIPGYIRTMTSTYVPNPDNPNEIIKFLRKVTVTVTAPDRLGGRVVTLETNIQTYQPQISSLLPVTSEAYLRDKPTTLEWSIRDDAWDIKKAAIKYRYRDYPDSWSDWIQIASIYEDIDRTLSFTGDTLVAGKTYYITLDQQLEGDGDIREIQIQATNTASIANLLPSSPQGSSAYIKLISDNTTPTVNSLELSPTRTITTGCTLHFGFLTSDPLVNNASSGIYNAYLFISRTPSGSSATYYWDESKRQWTTTPSPYWCSMTLSTTNPNNFYYDLTPTTPETPTVFLYEPWSSYRLEAVVLDNAIGKYYDYKEKIPTHGSSAGDYPDLVWPNVNANYTQVSTTLVMYPMPIVETDTAIYSTITATLYGKANSYELESEVWFEYGLDTDYGNSTTPQPFSATSTTVFSSNITGLSPNTTYHYRALIKNDWGVFYDEEDNTFTTLNQETSFTIPAIIPDGSEWWSAGSTKTSIWLILISQARQKIGLPQGGSTAWKTIIAFTPINHEQKPWTVTGPRSNNCKNRITNLEPRCVRHL